MARKMMGKKKGGMSKNMSYSEDSEEMMNKGMMGKKAMKKGKKPMMKKNKMGRS